MTIQDVAWLLLGSVLGIGLSFVVHGVWARLGAPKRQRVRWRPRG